MFINCPHCGALVATEPATDLPPRHCPRCATAMHGADPSAADAPDADAAAETEHATALVAASPATPATPSPASLDATGAARARARLPAQDDAGAGAAHSRDQAAPAGSPSRDPSPPRLDASADALGAPPPADAPALPHAADADAAPGSPRAPGIAARPADARLPAQSSGAASGDGPPPASTVRGAPSFARAPRTVAGFSARRHWISGVAIVALLLALALQLLIADRARLAADAQWRPLVAAVCTVFGCALPPWHEPGAFAMIDRDVRPQPDRACSALRVTARFRNDARWPQAWPKLRLTFSDIDGRVVAAREFSPPEYLGAAPVQRELASGQVAAIAMDIVEPGPRSVAFAFELH